jgi:DNA-binding phage protein
MTTEEAKILHEKISAYGLIQNLQHTITIRRKKGVARSTIYRAFEIGGETALLRFILNVAKELINIHESQLVPEEVMAE